jgi:steroid 5-alpha reductase family enzyme
MSCVDLRPTRRANAANFRCRRIPRASHACALRRHPNYFGEWMVWVSLAVVSLPSVANMWQLATHPWPTSAALTFGLVVCVHAMFVCLTTYTGAVPSEYYSVQKRPSYVDYQRRVPMFFPTFLGGRPLAHTQGACKEN